MLNSCALKGKETLTTSSMCSVSSTISSYLDSTRTYSVHFALSACAQIVLKLLKPFQLRSGRGSDK